MDIKVSSKGGKEKPSKSKTPQVQSTFAISQANSTTGVTSSLGWPHAQIDLSVWSEELYPRLDLVPHQGGELSKITNVAPGQYFPH